MIDKRTRYTWGKFRRNKEIVVCMILRQGPGWYRIVPANSNHMRITMKDGWVRLLPGPTDAEIAEYVRRRWPDEAEAVLQAIREADAKESAVRQR